MKMKPQNRNFIVEVKRTRLASKARKRSIWGNLDFANAIATEAALDEPRPTSPTDEISGPPPVETIEPRKPRILPAIDKPATLADPRVAAPDAVIGNFAENAVADVQTSLSVAPRAMRPSQRTRRKPRLHLMEKALPPGQRWKRRLPKILRQAD